MLSYTHINNKFASQCVFFSQRGNFVSDVVYQNNKKREGKLIIETCCIYMRAQQVTSANGFSIASAYGVQFYYIYATDNNNSYRVCLLQTVYRKKNVAFCYQPLE